MSVAVKDLGVSHTEYSRCLCNGIYEGCKNIVGRELKRNIARNFTGTVKAPYLYEGLASSSFPGFSPTRPPQRERERERETLESAGHVSPSFINSPGEVPVFERFVASNLVNI